MTHEIDLSLTPGQAGQLLPFRAGDVRMEFLRPHNHTWRIVADGECFFLKAHTKSWYGGRPSGAVVQREVSAHRVLRESGLLTPEIVGVSLTCDNPLGWPYMLSRALEGTALTELLPRLPRAEAEEALRQVGVRLARMHAITFEHPGYLTDGPPTSPPDPVGWQHWIWRLERLLGKAFSTWADDASQVEPPVMDAIARLLADKMTALRDTYDPPRFVHGDCHASQFFLTRQGRNWRVSGVVDLEIASSGSPLEDFVKLTIEMAGHFGAGPLRWWEPLFEGYGAIDFDLLRLRLLTADHINYVCHGSNSWPGTRPQIVRHLAGARTWADLFDLDAIETDSPTDP